MAQRPRQFAGYDCGLLLSYEEEISGIGYFAALAGFHQGRPRRALLLMSAIERATAAAIRPLLQRRGLRPAAADQLEASGRHQADHQRGLPWPQLVAEMADNYPAFVEEFRQIERLAPAEDRTAMGILIDHEVAAVAFAQREAAGDPRSLAPLEQFLAAHCKPLS